MSSPWTPEIDVPESLARNLLDQQFPEFADQPLTVLGEGWDNIAWKVGTDWVFRFPRRQLGADLIASEIAVMPHIASRLTTPVAWPRRHGRPNAEYPWPFAGYHLINGVELCEAAPAADQRLALAAKLGEFLRSLHSITADEAKQLGAPLDTYGRLDVERCRNQATEHLHQAAAAGIIGSPDRWTKLLRQLVPRCRPARTACLVHSDLYSRHIIVECNSQSADTDREQTTMSGIIDWGDVHAGDPAADLACSWSLFDSSGRQRLLESYGNVPTETLMLARVRALAHSSICAVYGRQGNLPMLEQAAKQALHWLLDD